MIEADGGRKQAYAVRAAGFARRFPAGMGAAAAASARSVRRSGVQLAVLAVLADVRLLADSQRIACHTTKGVLNLMLHKEWAPEAHTRFLELLESQFFNDQIFFDVQKRDTIQFGISGNPAVTREWRDRAFPDDPVHPTLTPAFGTLSFLSRGTGSRGTRLVISDSRHRAHFDEHERPFGQVVRLTLSRWRHALSLR